MKLVKSLLLGSAAGLMTVVGAQAADLPSRKAAPAADFVRVCPSANGFGNGFFVIPGTETCLRISGQVRGETLVGTNYSRYDDTSGFRARARVNFDARTQTGFGTLRTFIRLEANRGDGMYVSGASVFRGTAARNGGIPNSGSEIGGFRTEPTLAFVQFAGITAGRFTSFYDFYGTDGFWNFGGIAGTQGDSANGLAYTFSAGGGFSATVSLESRVDAERGLNGNGIAALGVQPLVANTQLLYAGQRYPDIVGVLRLQQGWGTAQLMGLVRNVNLATGGVVPAFAGERTGYAIGAGVMFNLPMLSPGAQLYLEGNYAKGVIAKLGVGSAVRVGYANVAAADYAFNAGTGTARLAEGYSLTAALRHFWTPTIRQHIFAGYTSVSYGTLGAAPIVPAALPGLTSTAGLRSFTKMEIGTNVIWSPVAGLDLGVEVLYKQVDPRGRFAYTTANGVAAAKGSEGAFEARFRVQRDF